MAPMLAASLATPELSVDFLRGSMPRGFDKTVIKLFVDPDGKVVECEVKVPDLPERKKDKICRDMIGQESGAAARDKNGNASHGYVNASIVRRSTFSLNKPSVVDLNSDANLTVLASQLPDGIINKRISLVVEIDELGKVRHCQQMPGEDQNFSEAACAQSTGHTFSVKSDGDGSPVTYIDIISVEFRLEI